MIIIIIIIINCNWVSTRWKWLIYMYTIAAKFTSGGPHEKHVVATWNLGNHLNITIIIIILTYSMEQSPS
jgi:hypothetical protein